MDGEENSSVPEVFLATSPKRSEVLPSTAGEEKPLVRKTAFMLDNIISVSFFFRCNNARNSRISIGSRL